MQYTESIVECLKGIAQEHREAIDWLSACEQVKDPRRKQGKRFSITSILSLALAAILSNHLSELALAQWGAGQSDERKKALGFENGVTPHQSTIQRLFRRVNAAEVETAFRHIFLQIVTSKTEKRGEGALSIDGKAKFSPEMPSIARDACALRFARAGGDYLFLVKGNQPQL